MRHLPHAALLAALLVTPPAAAKYKGFTTPSGNIGCYVDTTGGARCDIAQRDWSAPPKPSSCELDYGQGISVNRRGRGHFLCAGDTALGAGPVLAYGRSISAGRYTCTSRTTGVRCRNGKTGHGFFISRASYRLF